MAKRVLTHSDMNVLDNGYASFADVEFGGGKKLYTAAKTENNGRTVVTVTFADGNIYKFDCIKNGANISDVKEYWNGEPIYEEGS